MDYKEFKEELIERLREERGDTFQIEMRTHRMGRTEEEFLAATKYGEKEAAAFHPQFLYAQYEELQNFEAIVATVCNALDTYEQRLTFEKFTRAVFAEVSAYGKECKITEQENQNGPEKVLIVRDDEDYARSYNLSELYQQYLDSGELNEIAESIISTPQQEVPLKAEDLLDYRKMRGQICLAVTNGVNKNNTKFLQNVPNYSMLDLCVYPRIIGEDYSVAVTHNLIKAWGVSKDSIFKDAKNNMLKTCTVVECFPPIASVSNQYRNYGSGFLADEKTLRHLHKRYGDFYIIPDNIHFFMLISSINAKRMRMDEKSIQQLGIKARNIDPLPEESKLSDNIYFYDNKSLTLINTMGAYIQKQRYTFSISAPKPKM